MRISLILLVALFLFPPIVLAEQNHAEKAYREWLEKNWMTRYVKDWDSLVRFQVFAHCQPMRTKISSIDLQQEGRSLRQLHKEDVEKIVINRLHNHDLVYEISTRPKTKYVPKLEVKIQLNGPVFAVTMKLKKIIFEPASNRLGFGSTWSRTFVGEHRDKSLIVLAAVRFGIDSFLDDYFEANKSCTKEKEAMLKNKR